MLGFLWRITLCLFVWCGCYTFAEYLRDEDVHLRIYRPSTGQNAIALELIIYNRDEEFYVNIKSEEAKTICEGSFSRFSTDRVKCSYDTTVLKDGDNSFRVTIRSETTKEIVFDTISHFFYDSNRIVDGSFVDSMSENWDTITAVVLVVLIWRLGLPTYRGIKSLLTPSSTDMGPPSPPPPSLPVLIQDFNIPDLSTVAPSSALPSSHIEEPAGYTAVPQPAPPLITNNNMKYFKAALVGAAVVLGGTAVLGPRRLILEHRPHQQQQQVTDASSDTALSFRGGSSCSSMFYSLTTTSTRSQAVDGTSSTATADISQLSAVPALQCHSGRPHHYQDTAAPQPRRLVRSWAPQSRLSKPCGAM